jgi:hypothetical protein
MSIRRREPPKVTAHRNTARWICPDIDLSVLEQAIRDRGVEVLSRIGLGVIAPTVLAKQLVTAHRPWNDREQEKRYPGDDEANKYGLGDTCHPSRLE